jgi:ABC-type transport system involved in multi-copper enzyme maturation permease subunit
MLRMMAITRLTLREAARRRLLIAVGVLTLAAVAFTGWGIDRLTALSCARGACSESVDRGIAAVLLILLAFMFSFVFAVGSVFLAAPAISQEIESGVALAVLPRPVRRSEILLGKWLGLFILVAGYIILTAGLEFAVVYALVGYLPPGPVRAIAYLVGEATVLMTLALLASTRLAPMTGGIALLLLFGLSWMGGIAQGIGLALKSDLIASIGTATSLLLPTDGLWRGALYHLEPVVFVSAQSAAPDAAANPFLATAPPSPAYVVWAIVWIISVLALATISFRYREI